MQKNLKKLVALLLAAVLVCGLSPTAALAGNALSAEAPQGDILPVDPDPIPVDAAPNYGLIPVYHEGTQAVTDAYLRGEGEKVNYFNQDEPVQELPSKYDSRDYGYITSVKDQNPYGSCWAHGALGSVEAYMISHDVPVGNGAPATISLNLSETHHCFFNYSKAYDAEGMLEGDDCQISGDTCLDLGGNGEMSSYTLMRWTGAADESTNALAYSYAATVANSGLNKKYAYQYNVCHVQNTVWIPATNIDAVKQAVMAYGAGNISYYESGLARTYICTIDTSSTSSSTHKFSNHAITLVGWDDTVAPSNFPIGNRPNGPGAWICKNSWGTGYFDNGYCYISYEDTSVLEGYIYFYDAEPIDNYSHNYQYDGTCNVACYGMGWDEQEDYYTGFANGTQVANVFTAKGKELLRAVALCNWDEDLTYTVEIYKNPTQGDPTSGQLMTSQSGNLTFSGYYTIPLEEPVALEAGDTFSVVFTQSVPVADASGKYVHTPYDANFDMPDLLSWCVWYHADHGATSFYKQPDGAWTDCPDNGDYRIKAYTDDIRFNLTAVSNNEAWGTVVVNGPRITAVPAEGYYVESCEVLFGNADYSLSYNRITVEADEDCTVRVNFAPKAACTVSFVASGAFEGSQSALIYDSISLPAGLNAQAPEGWSFVGWIDHRIDETDEAPAFYAPGDSYTLTANATLYALYLRTEVLDTLVYRILADTPEDWTGGYVVTSGKDGNMLILKGRSGIESYQVSSGASSLADSGMTLDGNLLRNVDALYVFDASASSGGWNLVNRSTGTYLATDAFGVLHSRNNNSNYADWTLEYDLYAICMKVSNPDNSLNPYLVKGSNSYFTFDDDYTTRKTQFWKEAHDTHSYYWTDPIASEQAHRMEHTAAKAPTCLAAGNTEFWTCILCSKHFSDEAGQNEITLESTVLAALGHVYETTVVAPTCEEQGYDLHTCARCGHAYADAYADPLGYDYRVRFSTPVCMEAPQAVTVNTRVGMTLPVVQAPEGYTFVGWVTERYDNVAALPEQVYTGHYVPTGDVTLRALYSYLVPGEPERGFYLVTNAKNLAVGDQIIFTANGDKNNSLSTTQNSNNRASVDGVKSADHKTFEPAETTAILTLGEGTDANSFSFYDPANSGYLYAASSFSNYLRTQSSVDNNASWRITISGSEATVQAQGGSSHDLLRYNDSSNLFSCYISGQQTVFIYRYEEHSTGGWFYTTVLPVEGYPCSGDNCPGAALEDEPPKGHWAHDPIDWAYSLGITAGTSATTFSPNQSCTRAQVMTFLWVACGKPEPAGACAFTDVADSAYYAKAVTWAAERGITSGTSASTFGPNEFCTRAQVMTFLWIALDRPAPETGFNPFTDVTETDFFYEAVLWALENGVTSGTSAVTCSPNAPCSRAQIVTFLFNALAD